MKYLLDTDHISILQGRRGPEFAAVSAHLAQHSPADLAFCIISFHEQMLGCHTYLSRARSPGDLVRGYALLEEIRQSFADPPVLSFDAPAAAEFDNLVTQRIRVSTMDLRIASIALSRRLVVITRNSSDFRKVPGLVIEDWTV